MIFKLIWTKRTATNVVFLHICSSCGANKAEAAERQSRRALLVPSQHHKPPSPGQDSMLRDQWKAITDDESHESGVTGTPMAILMRKIPGATSKHSVFWTRIQWIILISEHWESYCIAQQSFNISRQASLISLNRNRKYWKLLCKLEISGFETRKIIQIIIKHGRNINFTTANQGLNSSPC
jgi:hypothetical protein